MQIPAQHFTLLSQRRIDHRQKHFAQTQNRTVSTQKCLGKFTIVNQKDISTTQLMEYPELLSVQTRSQTVSVCTL